MFTYLGLEASLAQELSFKSGYILTNDGNKIKGKIHYDKELNPTTVLFINSDGNQTIFSPNQIRGFKIKGGNFFSENNKIKGDEFIEQVFKGKISLFIHKNQLILTDYNDDLVFLNTEDNEKSRLENYNILLSLTSGLCYIEKSNPYKAFKNDIGSIIAILREFHYCESEAYKIYYKQPLILAYNLSLGFLFQSYPLSSPSWEAESPNGFSPFFLAGIQIKSPEPKLKKTRLDLGLGLSQSTITTIIFEENSIKAISGRQVTNVTAIHVPVIFVYEIPSKINISPYLGMGLMSSLKFGKIKSGLINDLEKDSQYAIIKPAEFMETPRFNLSPILKFGIKWKGNLYLESILGQQLNAQNIYFNGVNGSLTERFFSLSLGYKF